MQAKRINNWLTDSQLKTHLKKQNILEWLNEEGSITAKISSDSKFKLKILSDDLSIAEDEEYLALDIASEEVRIREVVLYGDLVPLVYARSIIPSLTSSKGYPGLGTIGSKPLGDLLFQSELFIKTRREFAQFETSFEDVIWGRRTHYLVRGYPLCVMEVFLLP